MRVFDKIYHGRYGIHPWSKSVDLIEILGEGFHFEDLSGHLQKVEPNESGSLGCFPFVRWYVDKGVSIDSAEEA